MKYTISDIARESGVSKATVSRVINNKDQGVGLETRERVRKVIERLNYRPNNLARSVAVSRSMMIGVIVPDIGNLFYCPILRGIDDAISAAGYSMLVCNTDHDPDREKRQLLSLVDKRADGVILCSGVSNERFLKEYRDYKTPVVLIGRTFDKYLSDASITGDNYTGAMEAVLHLIDGGHKQIAYLDGTEGVSGQIGRLGGYRAALTERGLGFAPELTSCGEFSIEWGRAAMERMIAGKQAFSAVFCGSDLIAIGALGALKAAGKKVPKDVELIGFDGIELADITDPPLSTVAKPHYEMGREAGRIMISIISGEPGFMRHITVQPTLKLQGTTR